MMKRTTCAWAALLCAAGWCLAEPASLVQVTDMRGESEYQVLSKEEFATLAKQIKEEEAAFPAALDACKKEWAANKDNKIPFQGAKIKARTAKKIGADYADREQADKKRVQIEESAAQRKSDALNKEKASAGRGRRAPKVDEKEVEKEAAKQQAANSAYQMVQKKMAEKLNREVPSFGFPMGDAKKVEQKKAGK